MTDQRVEKAKQLIADLNNELVQLAREGVRVEINTMSRNYIGTMGEEGVQLVATFLRKLG
jgi:hypothetical protein